MTETVERLRELEAKATPGPWVALKESPRWEEIQGQTESAIHQASRLDSRDGCIVGCWYDYSQTQGGMMSERSEEDAALIAEVRTALPALLAVVEAAQELATIWERFKEISPEPPSDTYRMDTQLALTAALDVQAEALARLHTQASDEGPR